MDHRVSRTWILLAPLCLVLLAGCTSDAGEGAEVAGAVLERDAAGEVAGPDEDDERTDPRDAGEDAVDDAADDAEEEAEGPDGAGEAPSAAQDDDGSERDGTDGAEAEDGTGAEVSSEPAPRSAPRAAPQPAPRPVPPAPSAPATPAPSAPATPTPSPDPVSLPSGAGELGAFLGFGDGGIELGGTGPIEADAGAGVVVDAVRADDGRVRCEARVRAARDRPLVALGLLRVDLVLQQRDGTERVIPRQLLDLDIRLPAGDTAALPRSPASTIDPVTLTEVRCATSFDPKPS